jgi:hypothetical protein
MRLIHRRIFYLTEFQYFVLLFVALKELSLKKIVV